MANSLSPSGCGSSKHKIKLVAGTSAPSGQTLNASAETDTHNFIRLCKQASLSGTGLRPVLQLAGYASKDKEVFNKIGTPVLL